MADAVKLIIVDGSVTLKRTISIKLMNDKALRFVSAVNSLQESADKIKFFKPDVIVFGVEKIDVSNLPVYEKFIKETKLPMVIITNESAKLLHLIREVRIEFVARPPFGDVKLAEQTADEVCKKIKKIKNIPHEGVASAGQAMGVSQSVAMPVNLQMQAASADKTQARANGGGFSSEMRSVYQIQGGNIAKPQLTTSRYGGFLIAIGSSTGGTEAIYAFLTQLPQDMPPILIVQHMPPVFTRLYAERLNMNCNLEVREAANGDAIYPGLALIAPGDRQMCLTRRGGKMAVECVRTDKVSGHCPSVDLMFESVAQSMGKNAIGVLMTGMGKDGAQGMLQMHNNGAFTIGQNEESCAVYGMPKAAFDIGAVDVQASPEKIPELLQRTLKEKFK